MAAGAWLNSKPGTWAMYLTRSGLCLASGVMGLVFCPFLSAGFSLAKLFILSTAVFLASLGAAFRPGPGTLAAPLLACLGALALSTASSLDPVTSLIGSRNSYVLGLWPMAMIASLCVLAGRAGEDDEGIALACMASSAALAGAYAVFQIATIAPAPLSHTVALGRRAISTVGSPVSFGAFEAMVLPVSLYWTRQPGRKAWFGWACLALCAAGLVASGTRAAWLSAVCGAVFFLVFAHKGRRLRPPSHGGSGSPAPETPGAGRLRSWKAGGAVLLGTAFLTAGLLWQVKARKAVAGRGDEARVEIWSIAWKAFQDAPLLGSGPDTFELDFRYRRSEAYIAARGSREHQVQAHNDFLQAMATTGFAGLAAYLWLLAVLAGRVKLALDDPERRGRAAGMGGALVSVFLFMKLNLASIEVFAGSALLAGFLGGGRLPAASREGGSKTLNGAVFAAMALFGGLSILMSWRLATADSRFMRAQKAAVSSHWDVVPTLLEESVARNPCETSYHVGLINHLMSLVRLEADPAARDRLLDRGTEVGELSVSCHPESSISYYSLGLARLLKARLGSAEALAGAETALDSALELDPNFSPIVEGRLQAAILRRDEPVARNLEARLKVLLEADRAVP